MVSVPGPFTVISGILGGWLSTIEDFSRSVEEYGFGDNRFGDGGGDGLGDVLSFFEPLPEFELME